MFLPQLRSVQPRLNYRKQNVLNLFGKVEKSVLITKEYKYLSSLELSTMNGFET